MSYGCHVSVLLHSPSSVSFTVPFPASIIIYVDKRFLKKVFCCIFFFFLSLHMMYSKVSVWDVKKMKEKNDGM